MSISSECYRDVSYLQFSIFQGINPVTVTNVQTQETLEIILSHIKDH